MKNLNRKELDIDFKRTNYLLLWNDPDCLENCGAVSMGDNVMDEVELSREIDADIADAELIEEFTARDIDHIIEVIYDCGYCLSAGAKEYLRDEIEFYYRSRIN